ncbi:hypothetical protein ABPG75_000414 [Micractinium tetrahymenae]
MEHSDALAGTSDGSARAAPPSLPHNLIARFKLGTYYLRPIERIEPAADGKPVIVLQPLLRIPLASASTSSPLSGQQWEASGRREAAELAARWGASGQPPSLAEAAQAAWRGQVALLWHAQHWNKAQLERLQQVPALLAALANEGGLALVLQHLQQVCQPAAASGGGTTLPARLPQQRGPDEEKAAWGAAPPLHERGWRQCASGQPHTLPRQASGLPPWDWRLPFEHGGPMPWDTRQLRDSTGMPHVPGPGWQPAWGDERAQHPPGRGPAPWPAGGPAAPPGEPLLAPVLIRHFRPAPREEWALVGREVMIAGVGRGGDMPAVTALLRNTGATVIDVRYDSRIRPYGGAVATLATAGQSAAAIERLQGHPMNNRWRLFLRENKEEVATIQGSCPREWAAACPEQADAEAAGQAPAASGGGPFWDPIWRLEVRCLQLVRASLGGEALLPQLLPSLGPSWPSELGVLSEGTLRTFLAHRSHLFLRCRGSDSVALVSGAAPFLRYKRCLLQYLADHPPRVELARLEGAVPKPAGLASDVGALSLYRFITKFLSREVWQLGSTA